MPLSLPFRSIFLFSLLLSAALYPVSADTEARDGNAADRDGLYTESAGSESSYIFDHITQRDGLPNNAVSGIVQDRKGYLWFGTQNGLCRYDGSSFKTWEHDPFDDDSLPHNLIQAVYLDPDEPLLWLGTYEGLSCFNLDSETFTNYLSQKEGQALSNEIVTSMVKSGDGLLWVGTLDGLNLLNPRTGEVKIFRHDEERSGSLLHNTVRCLLLDGEARLWVGSYGGLDLYRPESGDFRHFRAETDSPGSLPSPYVMALCQSDDSGLWLGTWDGGAAFFDFATERVEKTLSVEGENIYLMKSDPSGEIWIGSWGGGLFRWSPEREQMNRFRPEPDDPYKLNQGIVYSFFRDRGGIYWIGTNGGGINKLNTQKKDFRFINHLTGDPDSLPSDKIRDIMIDAEGRYWVSTYNNGLWRFEGKPGNWKSRNWMPDDENPWSLSHHNVVDVIEDSRGRIWVGTLGGLARYSPGTNDFNPIPLKKFSATPGNEPIVYNICEDIDGTFWIGTNGSGLIHLSQDDRVLDTYLYDSDSPELSNNLVYSLFLDSQGRFWAGTNRGLNLFDRESGKFEFFYHNSGDRSTLSNNVITGIFEDSRKWIWISTSGGGVNVLEPGADGFRHVTRHDGLISNHVQTVQEDLDGRIWISTISGICVLDIGDMSIQIIDESDGIVAGEMYVGSTVDRRGGIYFSSSIGILRFDTAILHDNPNPPALWMNDIQVMGKSVSFLDALREGREIVLSWDQSFISFEFAALDFTSPLQNKYRFRMDGVDRTWLSNGTRNYVSYQNLRPGHYSFQVQASNSDGVWNETGLTVALYVKAPPWKQRWFIIIYIIAAILAIGLFSNLQANALLKKKLNTAETKSMDLQLMNDRLEMMAWRDGLTGLSNRRYFDLSLKNLWHLAVREGKWISLMMIDVDHFKAFNDTYGHQEGDIALKRTADLIRGIIRRESDAVCRYGGEEFTVLLFDTGIEEAKDLAESLLDRVREAAIPHESSSVRPILTLSVGISGFVPAAEQLPELLIEEADNALYDAKSSGRDRIVISGETAGEERNER